MTHRLARQRVKERPAAEGVTHTFVLSTADALAVYEGLLLLSLFMARPKSGTRPYPRTLPTELRERLVKVAPELETYAAAAKEAAGVVDL